MLASCRMSQCRFDDAEETLMKVNDIIAAIGREMVVMLMVKESELN